MKFSRFRHFTLAAALVLGAGIAVPVVVGTSPAWALNCSFGDNFYEFNSNYTTFHDWTLGDAQTIGSDGYLYSLTSGVSGDQWCQKDYGYGAPYYAWILQGTSYCATLNASAGYKIDLVTCDSTKVSQEWALEDNQGGEDYNLVLNLYDTTRALYCTNGCDSETTFATGWVNNSPIWQWYLSGPYHQ